MVIRQLSFQRLRQGRQSTSTSKRLASSPIMNCFFAVNGSEINSVKAVLATHKEVFQEGTGTTQGYKAHIHMKENT